MPINEAQESRMIAERAARNKQNTKIPFLINIKDGRLIPNVPMLGGRPAEKAPSGQVIPARLPHPNYRPYTGSLKASEEERMKWIESSGFKIQTVNDTSEPAAPARRGVVLADVEPFDIGTATVNELIEFAQQEYNKTLSPAGGLKALRAQVGELARAAGAVTERSLA